MWRTRESNTDVRCPVCERDHLRVRRSCFRSSCWCPGCERTYALAELVPQLDEDDAARLQEAVGDHLSDRV